MSKFADFSLLTACLVRQGFDPNRECQRLVAALEDEGIESPDIGNTIATTSGLFEVLPNGDLLRIIVHIPQGPSWGKILNNGGVTDLDDPQNWHRYHLTECKAVTEWKSNMRKSRRRDGTFFYPVFQNGQQYSPELAKGGRQLLLCNYCRAKLESLIRGFRAEEFELGDFLAKGPEVSAFTGVDFQLDCDPKPNIYVPDWDKISRRFREIRKWRCSRCGIDLSNRGFRKFLHAHHRDRQKHNNTHWNLEALCIRCHARQHPENRQLSASPDLREFNRIFPETKLDGKY